MNIITALLFVVLIGFGVLIYPIWMIIHCLTSHSLEGKTKALWVLAMFFAWSLGAVLYGLFGCEKRSVPWISAIAIICLGLFSIFPIVNFISSAKQMAVAEFAKIDQLDMQELSYDETVRFKASLKTLQIEAKSPDLSEMHKALSFSELFRIYGKDNKITSEESREWMEKFGSRNMLDQEAFSEYVRGKR